MDGATLGDEIGTIPRVAVHCHRDDVHSRNDETPRVAFVRRLPYRILGREGDERLSFSVSKISRRSSETTYVRVAEVGLIEHHAREVELDVASVLIMQLGESTSVQSDAKRVQA